MMPVFEYHTTFHTGADLLLWAVLGSVITVTVLATLALFLLRGYGLYRIAKRRELHHAWLSWVPVGQDWVRGSISDQFRYLTQGKIQHRRVILSVSSAAYLLLKGIGTAVVFHNLIMTMGGFFAQAHMHYYMARFLAVGSALSFVTFAGWALRTVFHHMCMYDLYRSADPKNDAAMTIIGILVPILEPVFVICVRNRDEGMPPRRDRPSGSAEHTYEAPEEPVDAVYESPDTHFEDPE